MGGGIMNIIAEGAQNAILTGNPSKTFWKNTYAKFTNFGKQNFRVDAEGTRALRMTEESIFAFKIPRQADLLMDCYLSVDLPHIWSPIIPPQLLSKNPDKYSDWAPYNFKWIDNLGAQMIKQVTITCGNQKLQEFTGQYLLASMERDFSEQKTKLFNNMTGHVPELNNPGNFGARINAYPNAVYTTDQAGAEPSIRGRTLYIPLNAWFNMNSQMSFPLVSMQYSELTITITLRPVRELFQIRDVLDVDNNFPYVSPNFNQAYMQFYRFLQPPPDEVLAPDSYTDFRTDWNANIHLNCTYCFLSDDERNVFAEKEQMYIFKQIKETKYYNVTGVNKIKTDSIGMIANWLFYFQRSDVNMRNEWSNRTNWPYDYLPVDIIPARITDAENTVDSIGPGINTDGSLTGLYTTDTYTGRNQKDILKTMGILIEGGYREDISSVGVFDYVEKYARTAGCAPEGLYCYNFSLNTSPFDMQPSGALNSNRYSHIEFEFTTTIPPYNTTSPAINICDPLTNDIIGTNKNAWQLYEYNYDLTLFEERYNIITFTSGQAGLMFAT
jgi:hypothetical protein